MKVMIALPCYGSTVYALCMKSIMENIEHLNKKGIETACVYQLGDPYVEMARNHLVTKFMDGDFTDMIFVDIDLVFDNDAMFKLLRHDVDVIGGVYPYRSQLDKGFPAAAKLDDNNVPVCDMERGLVECEYIPTGFMRIKKGVFEVFDKIYPENFDEKGERLHFKTGQHFRDEGDQRWWGEDIYFCKLCRKNGFKIWTDPSINFIHIGVYMSAGNYQKFLANGGKWAE